MELRKNGRKLLDPIHVIDIRLLDANIILARYGTILNTSTAGLLIEVCPGDVNIPSRRAVDTGNHID